jgi:hypothetical protein
MSRFFKQDPQITWTKVLCPVCNQPTGPQSECYKNPPKNIPEHKRKIKHISLGLLPIFSKNCVFRNDNMWQADINYPVSQVLLKKIKEISGIEKINPIKSYAFQISVGKLFDEKSVKQEVNIAYKILIKELGSIELGDSEYVLTPDYIGIVFPNGKQFYSHAESIQQSMIISDLLEKIPKSSGIISNKQ